MSSALTPLASLIRPTTLDDVIGQDHLVGPGKPIRRYIESGKIPSMIFWGPPGSGKTSLAYIISQSLLGAEFFHLSGVLSKKEDVVRILHKARKNFAEGKQTILFLDEIHRWMKSQQDVLLPFVEKGIVTLIGATTENPSFTINNALISRTRVYHFEKITPEQCVVFLEKNLEKIHERYPMIEFHAEGERLTGAGARIMNENPHPNPLSQNPHPELPDNPHPNPLPKGEGGDHISKVRDGGKKRDSERREIPKYVTELARDFRTKPTNIEAFMWEILRDRRFENLKFRRQHPIKRYIADFYCAEVGLVIELDGKIHESQEEYDAIRDEFMRGGGCTVLRIQNEQVENDIAGVLEKIHDYINSIDLPLPSGEGRGEGQESESGDEVKQSDYQEEPLIQVGQKHTSFSLIAHLGNGDLRNTLNILETACMLAGEGVLTRDIILQAGEQTLLYDRDGEEHYNLISAMHKSLRDSDGDAAIYWIGRMLAGGEDPRYIVRRMINFASEDVYDPEALILANAVYEICEKMGMPECELPIMNLAYYLAELPKDNRIYRAMKAMQKDIGEYGNLSVPLHLRNAPTALMREVGYGKGYEYAHDLPEKKSSQEHFPDVLKGRKYRK